MNSKLIFTILLICIFMAGQGKSDKLNGLEKPSIEEDGISTSTMGTRNSSSLQRRSADLDLQRKMSDEEQNASAPIKLGGSKHDAARAVARNITALDLMTQERIAQLQSNGFGFISITLVIIAGFIFVFQYSKIQKNKALFDTLTHLSHRQQALLEQELRIARLKEQELLCELEYKTKSLTTYALSMVQKNETLKEVKESVELLMKKPDTHSENYKKLSRTIEFGLTLEKDWDDFKMYFQEVQTDFFPKLKERFPDLSASDLKLCALIRLNLSLKQSAAVLRISPDSVKVARHRLKKKFNLQNEENLNSFVLSL
jgi:hypothetical protein